jgi:hypothetical protein
VISTARLRRRGDEQQTINAVLLMSATSSL